jgi:hypothetical protein
MKVLCIDGTREKDDFSGPLPKEGQIYTVTGEYMGYNIFHQPVGMCYVIEELCPEGTLIYDKHKFLPLSDIDEESILQEREKEELCEQS